MALPLPHVFIGGVIIIAAVSSYEFFFKKNAPSLLDSFKGKGRHKDGDGPPPDATATSSTALPTPDGGLAPSPAVASPVPSGPQDYAGPAGMPRRPSPPLGRRRPAPPILSGLLAGRLPPPSPPSPGVPAIAGGRPVMTGNPVLDAIHVVGWHGFKREDMPIFKRAQAALGLQADGIPGPLTWGALAHAAATLRVPMPTIAPFSHWDGAPMGGGHPMARDRSV